MFVLKIIFFFFTIHENNFKKYSKHFQTPQETDNTTQMGKKNAKPTKNRSQKQNLYGYCAVLQENTCWICFSSSTHFRCFVSQATLNNTMQFTWESLLKKFPENFKIYRKTYTPEKVRLLKKCDDNWLNVQKTGNNFKT